MSTNDRRMFHNLPDGRLPPAGNRAFGRVAQLRNDGLKETPAGEVANSPQNGNGAGDGEVVHEIERMQSVIGKRMYRGLLKAVARVWNPKEIPDKTIQGKLLEHMHAAERGLLRAQAAREKAGLAAYAEILGSMKLSSVEQIDNLKTLQEIVMALEQKVVSRS